MSHFPKITITGGPSGRSVEIKQDGVRMKGVVKFLIRGDTKDVVYLWTKQIVEMDIEVDGEVDNVIEESNASA